jgi:hypothetical protein
MTYAIVLRSHSVINMQRAAPSRARKPHVVVTHPYLLASHLDLPRNRERCPLSSRLAASRTLLFRTKSGIFTSVIVKRTWAGFKAAAAVATTHILNPPEVLVGVTATKTVGVSKAIRHPSAAGRPVRGLDVHRRVTFIYKFNAPPAQVASSTPASLLLRVVLPHREMTNIRAGFKAGFLRRRDHRRLFRVMPSKTSTCQWSFLNGFSFTNTMFW